MKKSKYYKGVLLLAVGFLFVSLNSSSQDIKLTRLERKEARNAIRIANFNNLDKLLESRVFVLEADFLQNQHGDRTDVSPILNFINVNSSDIVMQTGTTFSSGNNGVGGVTAEGTMVSYKLTKKLKNLSYLLRITVHSNIGSYYVSINIDSNTKARAVITGLSRGKLIYDGYIRDPNNSRVFKGWNSI